MKIQMHTLLLGLVKLLVTALAMTCLFIFLLVVSNDPIRSWCQSAGIRMGIATNLTRGVHVIAVFLVSIACGVLLTRDRWIVRPAAIVSVFWFYGGELLGDVHALSDIPGASLSSLVRLWIIPFVCIVVVVSMFSPFFHDCGRILRRTGGTAIFWRVRDFREYRGQPPIK